LTNEWEKDDGAVKVLVDASQCDLWTRQGRILLQMGALEGAHTLFEQAHSLWEDVPHNEHIQVLRKTPQAKRILQQVAPQIEGNFGLLHFAFKRYNLALEHFRKALQLMEVNNDLMTEKEEQDTSSYLDTDWLGGGLVAPVARHTLYSEVTSNLAVTALYTVSNIVCVFVCDPNECLPSFRKNQCSVSLISVLSFVLCQTVPFARGCACHGRIDPSQSVRVLDRKECA
jgi:tetratricopeptide (TPR) repeat protein